jgi:nicotinate-nucleotide pyrophosphorylase (carboxylating)
MTIPPPVGTNVFKSAIVGSTIVLSSITESTISESVKQALHEDIGSGDITAQLIKADAMANASIISRQSAIFCGQPWANEVFHQINTDVELSWKVTDGDAIYPDQTICELTGPARALLSGERTALNFLQTLSGTATRTHQYVSAIEGTGATILDTRKTIPGLRHAQKYAVQCGGGANHRLGLFDAILVKENHIEAAGSLEKAIAAAQAINSNVLLEVEIESLEQLQQALDLGIERLLLDNMSVEQLKQAVDIAAATKTTKRAQLEASGGINIENIRLIADTGVDYISVGDLTKNVDSIDLSLRFDY